MGNEAEMSKYLNKILKNKAKKDIGTLKKSNGDYTTPGIDILEELAQKHYPTHTGKKRNRLPRCIHNKTRTTNKIQRLD